MTSLKKLYIISLLSLISPTSISCMELINIKLPYKKIERRNKDIKKRSTEIINNFLQNKDVADPNADIRVIDDRYTLMQEKINNKYKTLCMCIQQMYNINFNFYTYFQNIDKHLIITQEQKENIHSEIPMPHEVRYSYFLSYLKKTLRKNNIAESLVTFTCNNTRCCTESPIFTSHIEDDLLHIHVDKPGCINIRQKTLFDLSLNAQRGCCIALVNQLKHNTTAALLYLMVNAMTEKTINEKEFYILISPNRRLSLLNLALKSTQTTHLLKNLYIEDSDILLTIADYEKLCKIDTLHSVLAWLKEYAQNNQKPVIKNTPVPQHKICKSCLGKIKITNEHSDYPDWCNNCRSAYFGMLRLAI